MRVSVIFFLLIFYVSGLHAQAPAYNQYSDPFTSAYGDPGNATTDVVQLPGNDLLLTASIHGYPALIRTDVNGGRKWSKLMYSSTGSFSLIQLIYFDARAIYLLGNVSPASGYSALLIKIDTGGIVQWAKKITRGNKTQAISMIKSYDNKLLIFATDSVNSAILTKIDTSGNAIWSDRFYTGYPYPQAGGMPYGGYGPTEGPGNIIELPDHTLTLVTNTIQPYSITLFGGGYYTTPTGYITATIIKTDATGALLWSAKVQRMSNYNSYPISPIISTIGDVFYTSDHNYLLAMGGNFTLKVDSNANIINAKAVAGGYQFNFVSEYPQGNINIAENGGYCCGDIISGGYDFMLLHATSNFSNIVSNYQHMPPNALRGQGSYTTIGHVRQLTDKRFACTGSFTSLYMTNSVSTFIITDSAGNENCTAQPYTNTPFNDSGLYTSPASINMDSGITILPFIVNDSLLPIYHCNCDSLPNAKFGITIVGNTVYCSDSSQSVITYNWNFGDGSTDTARNPVHVYNSLYHTISLTVYNKCGMSVYTRQLYPSVIVDSVGIACNGVCSGYGRVVVRSGTPPYAYAWNGSSTQISATNNGLCPGNNTITVIDANHVSATVSISISSDSFVTSLSGRTDLSCYGMNNGSVTDSVLFGNGPYRYMWNNVTALNTATLNNLLAGRQVVTMTDGAGCSKNDTVFITQPDAITFTNVVTNDPCFGDAHGFINAVATGGTMPYSYTWDNDTLLNSSMLSGLRGGIHVLMVKDLNNCIANDTVIVTEPSLLADSINVVNARCYGMTNGLAVIHPFGGTPPYNIWQNAGQIPDSVYGLYAGAYPITIVDANNCQYVDTIHIGAPAAITITLSERPDTGNCSGTASVSVTGGTQSYRYSWSNNDTSKTIANLCGKYYAVVVTDSNNCVAIDSILVPSKTGVAEIANAADITIVPNPFIGYVTVSYENLHAKPFYIVVTDALGVTVSLVTVDDGNIHEVKINSSTWVPGFYFFNIVDAQKRVLIRRKMVKE